MLKQSKTQISLVIMLGLMIFCHVGFVLYRGAHPYVCFERKIHGGSAKAFGFFSAKEKHFHAASVKELKTIFNDQNYTLTKAKNEGRIPRLYLTQLPKDMYKRKVSKSTFIQVVLPHILKFNEQILADRARLLDMQKRQSEGKHLRHAEKMWLMKLASDYRCKSTRIETLLVHVDVVPPSLALAQAILESGWGTSSAAVQKNSTFGHMQTKTKVAKFTSLEHNVRAYIHNLNRHAAYAPFRKTRAALRAKNKEPNGQALAAGLKKYSVRGEAYIRDLRNLIHNHNLGNYDHMSLEKHMHL